MGIIRCIISKLVLSTFTMVAMKSVWETSAWRPNLPRSLPASGQGTAHDVPLVNVPLQGHKSLELYKIAKKLKNKKNTKNIIK